jgi:hypothetical protein
MEDISKTWAGLKGQIGRGIYQRLGEVVDGSRCCESSTGRAGGVDAATVHDLVVQHTTGRTLGVLGEPTVMSSR